MTGGNMKKRYPEHIGIIPDGNRRWALQHGMEKKDGYEYGLIPGLKLLQKAREYGIKEVTFYGFTVDNLKRPKCQVDSFKKACVDAINMLSKEGVDLLVTGDSSSDSFPKELLQYTTRTAINGGGILLNFLVNYGWKWDLNHIKLDGRPASYDISRIDLIVRFGGMRRLSGFLPIQSVYSDFYVDNHMWPDYSDEYFENALAWYAKQDITLGG